MNRFQRLTLHAGFGLLSALVACGLAWLLLYQANFFYGTWHDVAGIGAGIDRYGPQNRYKPGFGDTDRAQRIALFRAINEAVHHSGEGLREIAYQSPSSGGRQALLREPERVHLQDVARLIDVLRNFALLVGFAWLALLAIMAWRRQPLPGLKQQSLGLLAVLGLATGLLLAIGAERVFNTLHVWVFPKEHQWFFYYQDSLMSTMMLAPRLFGWIAAAWALLTLVNFLVLGAALHSLWPVPRQRS